MQLYPQFTREYIINHLTLNEAIIFYNEGIRIKQQLAALDAVKLFGIPSGGENISGNGEISENMDGDAIIRHYQSRQFDSSSFSDLILGGTP
jgi:hypothetical protein